MCLLAFGQLHAKGDDPSLKKQLKSIPQVKKVKKLKCSDHFVEKYEFWFEQHTDPKNAASPTFLQRCIIGHVDSEAPVVVELQGYEIYTTKAGELASHYNCNQLIIEHRYFAGSVPNDSVPWKTLTVDNAAHDQHLVIQAMRGVYDKSKFLSTGISKGGQTTMIHNYKYPDDIDASVCYVAPLNFEREDKRIYTFLDTVGSEVERAKIKAFQIECLQRKDELLPVFDSLAKVNAWTWVIDITKAFEYYVLEYSFAYWQWGTFRFLEMPDKGASSLDLIDHLLGVSGVSFFEDEGLENHQSYFYAALTEMGIYGYQTDGFENLLSQKELYTFDFTLPEGYANASFDGSEMLAVHEYILEEAENMIFIYGAQDTWSATGVQLKKGSEERGVYKFMLNNAYHDTRIKSFPEEQRKEIFGIIDTWIK